MTLLEHPESWLFRPVERGWLKSESLIDGSVDLEFVATLNEAISVSDENNRRIQEALNKR